MSLKNINQEKAAQILFILFLAVAMWYQFAPQPDPGATEFAQAQLIEKSDPSPEDQKKACALYASAVKAGNKDAAFGLSDCVGRSNAGTELQRKVLRYALLMIAEDAKKIVRSARNERKALGLTDPQIDEALKIDVIKILSGDVSAEDLAGSMPVKLN